LLRIEVSAHPLGSFGVERVHSNKQHEPVPYEMARVVEAIQHALDEVPEIYRKAALKHLLCQVSPNLMAQK
jgi:hypothetical protein